jgi:EAL domain-containing protein (putative c-di-GMP-specific phosphodiesterase class I)
VSINLSVKDLLNKALLPYIKQLLNDYPLDPKWITLEITESAFMYDPENAILAIKALHALGLRFSVDDFGTGYSSLSYLKQIPINELKIDQSFTRDIAKIDKVARLVHATVLLGHSLDMKVVAEGIEDQETFDILKEFGCDLGQGYLFSQPISSKDFLTWLRESKWGLIIS